MILRDVLQAMGDFPDAALLLAFLLVVVVWLICGTVEEISKGRGKGKL